MNDFKHIFNVDKFYNAYCFRYDFHQLLKFFSFSESSTFTRQHFLRKFDYFLPSLNHSNFSYIYSRFHSLPKNIQGQDIKITISDFIPRNPIDINNNLFIRQFHYFSITNPNFHRYFYVTFSRDNDKLSFKSFESFKFSSNLTKGKLVSYNNVYSFNFNLNKYSLSTNRQRSLGVIKYFSLSPYIFDKPCPPFPPTNSFSYDSFIPPSTPFIPETPTSSLIHKEKKNFAVLLPLLRSFSFSSSFNLPFSTNPFFIPLQFIIVHFKPSPSLLSFPFPTFKLFDLSSFLNLPLNSNSNPSHSNPSHSNTSHSNPSNDTPFDLLFHDLFLYLQTNNLKYIYCFHFQFFYSILESFISKCGRNFLSLGHKPSFSQDDSDVDDVLPKAILISGLFNFYNFSAFFPIPPSSKSTLNLINDFRDSIPPLFLRVPHLILAFSPFNLASTVHCSISHKLASSLFPSSSPSLPQLLNYLFSTHSSLFFILNPPFSFFKNFSDSSSSSSSPFSFSSILSLFPSSSSYRISAFFYLYFFSSSLLYILKSFDHFLSYYNTTLFSRFSVSLSSLSLSLFHNSGLGPSNLLSKYTNSLPKDTFLRTAYFGGLSTVFRHKVHNKVFAFDVNSLYPFSMLNPLPVNKPTLISNISLKDLPKFFGFLFATVSTPPGIFIPFLLTRPTLTHPKAPTGTFKGLFFSHELLYALELGYDITLHYGRLYDKKVLCRDYVLHFFNLKLINKDQPIKRFIAKLFLNTLYGKLAQKPNLNTLPNDFQDLDLLHKRPFKLTPSDIIPSSPQIGAAITAYSRIHMHKLLVKFQDHLLYSDTDSIYLDIDLRKTNPELIGDDIGLLKFEGAYDKAIFLKSKTYLLFKSASPSWLPSSWPGSSASGCPCSSPSSALASHEKSPFSIDTARLSVLLLLSLAV